MPMKNSKIFETEIASRKLTFEVGALARKARSSVLARYGETIVLATVCTKEASPDIDFLPLTVDFEEKLYASGRISTSRFIKREGRPSEQAILTARLIDRSIRPLFDKNYHKEIQIILSVLSFDQENDPDILGILATSAALSISGIPWAGPIAAVKVCHKDKGYLVNPQQKELETSGLEMIVAGTKDKTVMLEGQANQASEEIALGAIEHAQKEMQPAISLIEEMVKTLGVKVETTSGIDVPAKQLKVIEDFVNKEVLVELNDPEVFASEDFSDKAKEKLFEKFGETTGKRELSSIFEKEAKLFVRKRILEGQRPGGRKNDEVRPLSAAVSLLPRTHGSALFERGETQILSVVTLGSPALGQLIEGMYGERTKRFMHHYNFSPFSTGEVRRAGSPGRREIGHGALAEKALLPMIPSEDEFPYTIRIVSEVLSSAGSTSMGSACGSSLALMDAGVPIKEAVAGIAIGLITSEKKPLILTDIAYAEDAFGDMDFKAAGTKNGLTAIQMDLKITGVDSAILKESLIQAKAARLKILAKMNEAISKPRDDLSPYAPRVALLHIDPKKIGDIIGSGGRVIRKIMEETQTTIDVNDDGEVKISGKDPELCQKAVDWISGIVKEVLAGEMYEGEVTRILPFGAMVEFLPGKEGLVHISKLAPQRVERVEDIVKVGQTVKVRVSEIDPQGRVNLSMNLEGDPEMPDRRPQRDSRPRQRDRNFRGGRRF